VKNCITSRLPVFKKQPDEIVGIINTKDPLAQAKRILTGDSAIRPPLFRTESNSISDPAERVSKLSASILPPWSMNLAAPAAS